MEWIDINDRLPDEEGEYFIIDVYDGETYYHEATFNDGKFKEPYYGQDISGSFDSVTHWMKPEPPNN